MWIWVAIVALLTLFFFGCSREGLKGWKTTETGIDYYGNDIGSSNADAAGCAKACSDDPTCNTFTTNAGANYCWKKAKAENKGNNGDRISRQVTTLAEGAPFRCEFNASTLGASDQGAVFRYHKDLAGKDMGNHLPNEAIADSWSSTWRAASDYVNCAGITRGVDMQTKPSADWTFEPDTTYFNSQLGITSGDGTDASCLKKCENNDKCVAAVLDLNKTCYLFSSVGNPTTEKGISAYKYKRPALPAGWVAQANTDYAGNDSLGQIGNTSTEACVAACASNAACMGVGVDKRKNSSGVPNNKCFLKTAMVASNAKGLTDFNSYIKPSTTAMAAPAGWTLEEIGRASCRERC